MIYAVNAGEPWGTIVPVEAIKVDIKYEEADKWLDDWYSKHPHIKRPSESAS